MTMPTVQHAALKKALGRIPKSFRQTPLQLRFQQNQLVIRAAWGQAWLDSFCSAQTQVQPPFQIAVDAAVLEQILEQTEVVAELSLDIEKLTLRGGDLVTPLSCDFYSPAKTSPLPEDSVQQDALPYDAAALSRALGYVLQACPASDPRPYLNLVTFKAAGGKPASVVATDGARLHQADIPPLPFDIRLDSTVALTLARNLTSGELKLTGSSKNPVTFSQAGAWVLYSPQKDVTLPDWEALLRETSTPLTFKAQVLTAALKKLTPFIVTVTTKAANVTFTATADMDPDLDGPLPDPQKLRCGSSRSVEDFSINSDFLLQAISAASPETDVTLLCGTPTQPVQINISKTPDGILDMFVVADEPVLGFMALVMPCQATVPAPHEQPLTDSP